MTLAGERIRPGLLTATRSFLATDNLHRDRVVVCMLSLLLKLYVGTGGVAGLADRRGAVQPEMICLPLNTG
jgi:hypothetical protein